MKTLYVTEQGATLHKEKKRLVVRKNKEILGRFPVFELKRVLVFGGVQLTSQAQGFLLERGIDVSFHTRSGRLRGRLVSEDSTNIFLRLAQYDRYQDQAYRLQFAHNIIAAKIANQRTAIQHHTKNHPHETLHHAIEALTNSLATLPQAHSIEQLMGHEGSASKVYFSTFPIMLRQKGISYQGRTKRPARDPTNALLNLGYTLLRNELTSLLLSSGLEPFLGFMHGLRHGRKSLALDFMEEFRQPVVDRFVLTQINRRQVQPSDFETDPSLGVTLKGASFKKFLRTWEERLTTPHEKMQRITERCFAFKSENSKTL